MSQLLTIAERLKAVTNIQKIAHAMQLISMSNLSRINAQKKAFTLYINELEKLSEQVGFTSKIILPEKKARTLYVIIGSQKGFCGNFNGILFQYLKLTQDISKISACIPIGPYAYNLCNQHHIPIQSAKINYSLANLAQKTNLIFEEIQKAHKNFDSLMIISNLNISIFTQKPQSTIISLAHTSPANSNPELPFIIEQPFEEIFAYINNITIKTKIFQLLLESLRAENSARALTMDSSTRNAKKLLAEMKLMYNKLRQAKVTKELIELSSSL